MIPPGLIDKVRKVVKVVRMLLIVAVVAMFAYFWVYFEPMTLPSEYRAMSPFLRGGERVLLRVRLDPSSLVRFNIVVYRPPGNDKLKLIGRVIGLPGETIASQNGVIYINDQILLEDFYPPGVLRTAMPQDIPPCKVPDGHFFILTDNRGYTGYDSREFGPVPGGNIESRLVVKF